jgi:hypothetical protein
VMELRNVVRCVAISAILVCASSHCATAGSYYVYSCSSYGNSAPAFAPYTNADHLTPANGCMQPAPAGGYRSLELNNPGPNAPVLRGYGANWTANSPSPALSIVGAYTPVNTVFVDCYLHTDGFTAQYVWASGTQQIDHVNGCNSEGYGYGTGINASFAPSSYFGWGAGCWLASSCSTSSNVGAVLGVQGIRLTVEEDSGPSVVADGSNNLWYQASGWVRSGGWPVTFTANDASGVCGTQLVVNGQWLATDFTNDSSHDTSSFMQCWGSDTPTGTLDTRSYADGPLSINYAAVNAAGVLSYPGETIRIDNTPVTLSLSTPNDADTNAWVNHAVKVHAAASFGPSGFRGIGCSTNGGAIHAFPASGMTLNGSGVWTVACSAQNNAIDVNGQVGSSPTQTVRVHIDETPPTLSFEPSSPSDPQAVVADAVDTQSGAAGGQIQIRPATGGSWTSLQTQFDGRRLLTHLDDASLAPGQWDVEATSCDNAGNCSSTQEALTLPLRTSSDVKVGFGTAKDALLGCRVRKSGRRHHRRARKLCHRIHFAPRKQAAIAFGRTAIVRGALTTSQGTPISGAPIAILTAPDNGLGQYAQIASVTTDANGIWTAALAPGPSRIIQGVYAGSPTIQPSSGQARLRVPAAVRVMRVWPRHVRWGGEIHIKARLLGGFLPAEGALVRLRLGYGNARITYGVREHVGGDGIFEVTNRFGPGPPGIVRHYWLQECTLPEGDYPFLPACGPRSAVRVGG